MRISLPFALSRKSKQMTIVFRFNNRATMKFLKMWLALSYPYSDKSWKTKRHLRDSDCTPQIDTKVIVCLQPRVMSCHRRACFAGTILNSDAGICLYLVVFIVKYTIIVIYMAFQWFVWSFQRRSGNIAIPLVCLNWGDFFHRSSAGLIDVRGWFERNLLTFRNVSNSWNVKWSDDHDWMAVLHTTKPLQLMIIDSNARLVPLQVCDTFHSAFPRFVRMMPACNFTDLVRLLQSTPLSACLSSPTD
jgi:hypothetical protein